MASHLKKVPYLITAPTKAKANVITYDRKYLLFSNKQQPKQKIFLKVYATFFNSYVHNI